MRDLDDTLIWEAFNNSKKNLIKESLDIDEDTADDILAYFADGNSIDDIAEEFDLNPDQVRAVIKRSRNKIEDIDDIYRQYGLDKKHKSNTIKLDPEKRSDAIDYEYNPEYEENAVKGKVSSRKIYNQRERYKGGKKRKRPFNEIE